MKIAVISVNLNFFTPLQNALTDKGHELRFYKQTDDNGKNCWLLGDLIRWCDIIFFEFCQSPMNIAMPYILGKPVAARLHRIELYNPIIKSLDWSKVNILFTSASHVKDKFVNTLTVNKKAMPKNIFVFKTNSVDFNQFKFRERQFKKPYSIGMVSRFTPLKRVYTAIQMFKDIEDDFVLNIVGGYDTSSAYYVEILDLIETLELKGKVNLLGHIHHEAMSEFMRDSDIILSMSTEEGTAVSIAEAMATGCYPMINCWKGSEAIYPDEYIFKTFTQFYNNIRFWKELTADKKLQKSREASEYIKSNLNETNVLKEMIEEIEKLCPTEMMNLQELTGKAISL